MIDRDEFNACVSTARHEGKATGEAKANKRFAARDKKIANRLVRGLVAVLNVGDDLGAFEGVFDVRKLERGLIDSCTEYVEAARFLETFGGEFFLRCQKVTCGLPNFLLLEGVHAGRRIPLLVAPHGLDFDKDEFVSIAGDDVEFSATVSVVAG